MRLALTSVALAAALAAMVGAGCGTRARPYRFTSPMLGTAEVPRAPLRGDPIERPARPALANREAAGIRVVSAPVIREASAAAAEAIVAQAAAQPEARAALPAPHRLPAGTALPTIRETPGLRALVGVRDPRDAAAVALGWAHALGRTVEATTGPELVAWAEPAGRLADPNALALPGDLLVFDHATSDAEADLLAIVIARDDRGVTEYLYVGNGVIRRGFVDPTRPTARRDAQAKVVNTYLRHGKRWPAKGSHYLAGELLAHVVHTQ